MSQREQTERSRFEYFTGPPGHEYFHKDPLCDRLSDLWGDMTPDVAIQVTYDDNDLDPCPRCILA